MPLLSLLFLYVRSNRRFTEWEAMAAVAAITKVLEGISLVVVVGNGGQPYIALQKLELERNTLAPHSHE